MSIKDLRVDGARLRRSLETMAAIGATPGGGVQRLALSDEDKQARDLFVRWLKEIDCEVSIDEMGNIFGRRPGKNRELPAVMSGSHLDSQPKGGRFDGVLGVMGALEVMRTLHDHKIETERDLVIVDWTNEEGSRFAPAMVSSGVWVGKLERDWAYSRTDINGLKQGDELARIGYKGETPARAFPIHANYELHIEQGPMLEAEGRTIGAPKGVLCLHWYDIRLTGTANQVGPTPMAGRNDCLLAAAEMIQTVNKVAHLKGDMVATVGEIHNYPNSRNIIPDGVHFTVDIRSWEDDHAIGAWEVMRREFEAIADRHGTPIEMEITWRVVRAPFAEELVQNVLDTAAELGHSSLYMVSGAGHDCSYINQIAPAAMIFIPSKGGRSHVEVEESSWEDCEKGANVLLHCMLTSAQQL
ncbi:MAG TPA: Zn-dependent hydrolase [Desulfofustis sp.]|jgi:N-carbamoyl-L-amino-acid hydrolase|nr:M20 family metallo-hydrolase [Desulfofustis sp. PB-SRB1]HBH27784.1 Zn-dependent hydrolase [Desulfofustis sp.]HBH32908.1 Zn-dependent hydrolase [Desulfofustis sp.]